VLGGPESGEAFGLAAPRWAYTPLGHHEHALHAANALTTDATSASTVVDTLMAYVLGATARELAEAQTRRRTGMTEDTWRQLVGPYIQQVIHSGQYPHLARVTREADDRDHQQRFEFGLACILDGVAARTQPIPPV
jgi:hypothetical protein